MRTHGDYAVCQLWPFGASEREILGSGRIAVARFESIQRSSRLWGWLDLTFALGDETTVVSGILVDLVAAARNDAVALIFPRAAAAGIDLLRSGDLTAFLLPHVRMLTRARAVPVEEIVRFLPCPAFEQAREAGELGAAPLTKALARMAPWVAAARLATGGPIATGTRDAALGAAVARRFGIPVAAAPEMNGAWYRIAPGTSTEAPEIAVVETLAGAGDAPFRVVLSADGEPAAGARVVSVPRPLPMEAVFTYDPEDAPVVARFTVAAPRRPAAFEPRSPSRPRTNVRELAFFVRDDFESAPDADTDELEELVLRAQRAGIRASFAGTDDVAALAPDIVAVACGALGDPELERVLAALAERRAPFAAMAAPATPDASWYEEALTRAVPAEDDELLEAACRAFDARTLDPGPRGANAPGSARRPVPGPLAAAALVVPAVTDGSEDIAAVLAPAEVTFAAVGPIVPPDEGDDDVGTLCGYGPYVFAHAPAAPRSGLLALALALRDTDIACVIATTVVDLEYVAELHRMAGPRTIVLTGATPGEVNALYRHATIFADPSLRPRGVSRIVRAARGGALPVVFAESPLARLLPSESIVARTAIGDLRDTIVRLWQSPKLANHRSLVRTMFATTLGDPTKVDAAAEAIFDRFAALGD